MKIKNAYLRKLLDAFEATEALAIDLRELQKYGFDYADDKDFALHMQYMNDKGCIEREDKGPGFGLDKAADGALMWSVLPLRLTASGHEFLSQLRNAEKGNFEPPQKSDFSLDRGMRYVFISYVRENTNQVDLLAKALRHVGMNVWLDREQIKPGQRWRSAIKKAIQEGAFFIACFSSEYEARDKTFMNEELVLAIEELRLRPSQRTWFLPILLPGGQIPVRSIGAGETLADLQYVDLAADWNRGVERLISAIQESQAKNVAVEIHSNEELELNSHYRVQIAMVSTQEEDDDPVDPAPFIVAQRLSNFGFRVSHGWWTIRVF